MTPSQLAREKRSVDAAANLGPISDATLLAIQAMRDGFAFKRAQKAKQVPASFPDVDRRVGERRCYERRSLSDLLSAVATKRDAQRFDSPRVTAFDDLA